MSRMQIGDGTFTIGCIRDISGRKAYTEALEHRALHDDAHRAPEPRAVRRPHRPVDRAGRARRRAARRARPRPRRLPRGQRHATGARSATPCCRRSPSGSAERVRDADTVARLERRRVRHPARRRDRRRDRRGRSPGSVRAAFEQPVPHRRHEIVTCARASASPSSRSTAARPPTCCAGPSWRCTRPSASGSGLAVFSRRAGGPDRAPALAAERAARRHPARRARAALPAEGRPAPARCGSSASRRWCAGSTPPRGLLMPDAVHARGRSQRADRAADRLGARRGAAPAERVERRAAST